MYPRGQTYYIGIDPSYSKTGVSYLSFETKEIHFNVVSPEGTNETYRDKLIRAESIVENILGQHNPYETILNIILEEPMITSQVASSLGILSGVISTNLRQDHGVNEVYTIPPNAVSNTNRKRKEYTSKTRKRVSQTLALEYIKVFENHGYTITIHNDKYNKDGSMKKRKLSTDEAESFIMLLLLLKHLEIIDNKIWLDLIKINKGLNNKPQIKPLK